jgi:hypothetical protein
MARKPPKVKRVKAVAPEATASVPDVPLSEAEAAEIRELDGSMVVQTLRIAEMSVAYDEDRQTRETLIVVIRERGSNLEIYEKRKLDLGELVVRMRDKEEAIRQAINEYRNIRSRYQTRVEEIAAERGIHRDTHKFLATAMAFVPR